MGNTLSAQVKITGKVTDVENGNPIAGATVLVKDNTKGVTTDVDGIFFVPAQKNTRYTLQISFVGYKTKEITDVEVLDETPAPIIITLERTSQQLQGVVVRSTSARKETAASLYAFQKINAAISDGISAEVIRKSPDRNTGDVLKRVSGTSIQDNKFVIIRGLSERYNVSMLNNAVLPSTEADKKAFSFDIIPSSVVDNIIIYKSPTADLPGDFVGGAVKVVTKDFPAKTLSELSLSLGYNTLTTGKEFYKPTSTGKYDALGFLDDSRQIPGPYYRHMSDFISQSDDFKQAITKMFNTSFGYTTTNKSLPSVSLSYTGGTTKIFQSNNKLGYIYSINYGTGRTLYTRERTQFDITKREIYDYNNNNYEEKNNVTALLNLSYAYRKSKVALKNLFNNNFSRIISLRQGANFENENGTFYIKGVNNEINQTGLFNSVLEGIHKLEKQWDVDWNGSFSYAYKNQPDQRILNFVSTQQSEGYYLKLSNQNSPEIKNAGRIYSFLNEYIYGLSANAAKQFDWFGQTHKLKFGTLNNYRDRAVEADALGYAGLTSNGVTITESTSATFTNIFSQANIDQYGLTVANLPTLSTNYTGNAMLNAGYAMLDNKFNDKLKLTWGARFERYHQELITKGKATKTYDNNDILPSLLLTYGLNTQTNLRLAASQAVNRPEFRELAPYRTYDYDNEWLIQGNEALERSRITNADLRYEWFPASGEIVSASVFYKYFDKPIEQVNQGNDVLSYSNADNAVTYGAEVEIRKRLGFITNSDFLDHLTFYANGSYLHGEVKFDGTKINNPLQGLSPYLINGGLNYTADNDNFSVNVLYNRIGPRLKFRSAANGALNIYEKPRDLVDFQISKKFLKSEKLEAKLTASDILAQPFIWYSKYDSNTSNINYNNEEDKIIQKSRYGTNISLSLRYKFN
ncbi:MAG: TonB-dependent receptor [Niabella sp.]